MQLKVSSDRHLLLLQYVFFVSIMLYFGETVFIPLSFALLISCILYPFCAWLERHRFSKITAIAIGISVIIMLITAVIVLLILQLISFFKDWPQLQSRFGSAFEEISTWLSGNLHIEREKQTAWISQYFSGTESNPMQIIRKIISASAVGAVMLILIPIYAVLILYYRHKWMDVLYRIFPHEGHDRIKEIVSLSIKSYYNFIKGMALVYLIVGTLNSIGLYLLGIPHALLFGFIASILTFIPYVGIIVASLLPISMAWITYNTIWYPLGVVAIFAFVQYLEANLIFPLAVSSRLKVNTLVTIVAIFTGGVLWGVSGMILFIPFLGILKMVADRTPSLKTLSIILGD